MSEDLEKLYLSAIPLLSWCRSSCDPPGEGPVSLVSFLNLLASPFPQRWDVLIYKKQLSTGLQLLLRPQCLPLSSQVLQARYCDIAG